jgi:hypothetical protein
MNSKPLRFGLAAAAVVLIAVVGLQFLGNSNTGDPDATETPLQTATSSDSAEPSAAAAGLPVGSSHVLWEYPQGGIKIVVTIPAPGWFPAGKGILVPGNGILRKNNDADAPNGARLSVDARDNTFLAGAGDMYVYGDPCHWASTTPATPVTTVDEAIAALSAQPSRDASAPKDVTLDGYAGKRVTLHVPDDAIFADCDAGQFRTFVQNWPRSHEDPGQFDLLFVLDVKGHLVIFDVSYFEGAQGTPESVIDEMAAIMESAILEVDY